MGFDEGFGAAFGEEAVVPSGGDAWGQGSGDPFADQAFGFGAVAQDSSWGNAPSSGGQWGLDASAGTSAGGGNGGGFGSLSEDEARRISREFNQSVGPGGFVSGEEGKRLLQQTGLPDPMLHTIWDLSDLDRDHRLSLREFTCAMHLASQCSRGRALPVEVRPEQQEALARDVERFSGRERSSGFEDWSTADTATSGVRGSTHQSKRSGMGSRSRKQDHSPSRIGDGSVYDDAGRSATGAFEAGGRGVDSAGLGFDTPGGLGQRSRGRDPAPRPLDSVGEHGPRGVRAASRSMDARMDGAGLDQLASVFEMVARLDSGGELRRLSEKVIEERRELEKQLSRRRDFERQFQDSRAQLDALREERRRVETEAAATQRHIAHLQDELMFVNKEVADAEEDLRHVREAAELPRGASKERHRGPTPYASAEEERRDVLSKVRSERELLQRDQRHIEELRARLEEVFKMKHDAQALQQSLLEKQRQTEQDRGLMLTAIEAERGKLSALRAERISMWEERSKLEREMTDVAQERWLAEQQGPPGALARRELGAAVRGPGVPTSDQPKSSPSAPDRRRGVPQDDRPPPAVVLGGPPGASLSEGYRGGSAPSDPYERYGFSQERRGASFAGDSFRGQPEVSRGPGYESRKADARGVRNEATTSVPFGGGAGSLSSTPDRGWNYGFGGESAASALSANSRLTATFGT